jgi:hypothetical protein
VSTAGTALQLHGRLLQRRGEAVFIHIRAISPTWRHADRRADRPSRLRGGDEIVHKDSETADDIAITLLCRRDLPGVVCATPCSCSAAAGDRRSIPQAILFDSAYVKARSRCAARADSRRCSRSTRLTTSRWRSHQSTSSGRTCRSLVEARRRSSRTRSWPSRHRLIALLREDGRHTVASAVLNRHRPNLHAEASGYIGVGAVPEALQVLAPPPSLETAYWQQARSGSQLHARSTVVGGTTGDQSVNLVGGAMTDPVARGHRWPTASWSDVRATSGLTCGRHHLLRVAASSVDARVTSEAEWLCGTGCMIVRLQRQQLHTPSTSSVSRAPDAEAILRELLRGA